MPSDKKLPNALIRVLSCLSLLLVMSSPSHAETIVIMSAKSAAASLTIEQVADLFLGKVKTLPNGTVVVPVDLPEGSALRDEFYGKTCSKTAPQMKAYWSKMIFTGKGQPPKEVADSASVKKLVAENPNLIGYIDKSALDGSVKSLLVVH